MNIWELLYSFVFDRGYGFSSVEICHILLTSTERNTSRHKEYGSKYIWKSVSFIIYCSVSTVVNQEEPGLTLCDTAIWNELIFLSLALFTAQEILRSPYRINCFPRISVVENTFSCPLMEFGIHNFRKEGLSR